MARSRGKIQKAVIARIARDKRIPLAAASHKYDCMSAERKQALCEREARAHQATKDTQP